MVQALLSSRRPAFHLLRLPRGTVWCLRLWGDLKRLASIRTGLFSRTGPTDIPNHLMNRNRCSPLRQEHPSAHPGPLLVRQSHLFPVPTGRNTYFTNLHQSRTIPHRFPSNKRTADLIHCTVRTATAALLHQEAFSRPSPSLPHW